MLVDIGKVPFCKMLHKCTRMESGRSRQHLNFLPRHPLLYEIVHTTHVHPTFAIFGGSLPTAEDGYWLRRPAGRTATVEWPLRYVGLFSHFSWWHDFMVVGLGTPVVSYAPRPMLVSERIVGIL